MTTVDSSWTLLARGLAVGAASGISPCITTRLAVLTGVSSGAAPRRTVAVGAAFSAGLVVASVFAACSASFWLRIASASPYLYAFLAVMLSWLGFRKLFGLDKRHDHVCRAKEHHASCAWAFLNGTSLGLVGSPCCVPTIAALVAFVASDAQSRLLELGVATSFACGQLIPLVALALSGFAIPALKRQALQSSFEIVGGAVLVSLGAYYALLT